MKRNGWFNVWRTIIFVMAIMVISVSTACNVKPDGEKQSVVGEYYYDATDAEYTVSFADDNTFTFNVMGENRQGEYTIDGKELVLEFKKDNVFDKQEKLDATMKEDLKSISFTYNGAEMNFIKKVNYTVTFDTNGGSSVDSATVVNGKSPQKPSDPKMGGYEFLGWFTDEALTKPFVFGTDTVTANTSLYAKWSKIVSGQLEYTVNFDMNYEGAPEVASQQTLYNKVVSIPSANREGYDFAGWWVSVDDDVASLSYPLTENTKFYESSTVYALWLKEEANKLSTPVVTLSENGADWNAVEDANTYLFVVEGPDGDEVVEKVTSSTNESIDFSALEAGNYTVKVTAVSQKTNVANSDTATRVWKNKALARVSNFSVAEPTTLLFNPVENAEGYYITIDCGNEEHNHTMFNNGKSTNFNFVNCDMQKGGIGFTVTAIANGYASSTSRTFYYDKSLTAVTGMKVDEATQTLSWNSVANTANYVVTVKSGEKEYTFDNGANTSVSLKEYDKGTVTVSVYPEMDGWNSPDATTYEYQKNTIATPSGVKMVGDVVYWNACEGATSYEVSVNGQTYNVNENQIDFSDNESFVDGKDYVLKITAKGDASSLPSDGVDMRYYAMYKNLSYSENVVSWRNVLGAKKYEVKVNEAEAVSVEDGSNSAEVVLTKAGVNTISVRFFEGTYYSEWASIEVYAHTVNFDSRLGAGVSEAYVAVGDKLSLPTTTRDGYDFAGWYNAPGGPKSNAREYSDKVYSQAGDATLFAYWTPHAFSVKYNYGTGGTGTENEGKAVFGSSFTFEVPVANDNVVVFSGWYSEPGGNGIQYTDENGESVVPWNVPNDATVYACWLEILTYTLKNTDHEYYAVSKGPGIGLVESIVIPETFNGIPVEEIGGYAFQSCPNLKKVTLPNSIKFIDLPGTPFYATNKIEEFVMTEVIPDSEANYYVSDGMLLYRDRDSSGAVVEQGIAYFPNSKTGSVVIPEGVTVIAYKTFENSNFSEVVIPSTVSVIERYAFWNCRELVKVTFAETTEGDPVDLTLFRYAFYSPASLEEITLPARVLHIGAYYSEDELVTDISAESIDLVFNGASNLKRINIEDGNARFSSVDGMITDGERKTVIYCPKGRDGVVKFPAGVTAVGFEAFKKCKQIKEVVFPAYMQNDDENVAIGESSFESCTMLEKITFGGGVSSGELSVGDNAFKGCSRLRFVEFEDGSNVSSIGNYAFDGAVRLESITIPASVKEVGDNAFDGCLKLLFVTIEEGENEITFGDSVFNGCNELNEIFIPARVSSFPSSSFNTCGNLTNVVVSEENEYYEIHDGVLFTKGLKEIVFFSYGSTAKEYVMPSEVETIGDGVFTGRTRLEKITIGKNVKFIGDNAFYGCINLKEVLFETGGTENLEIGNGAFAECVALTTINFPNRVTHLGSEVLYNCALLAEVTLPEDITEIGDSAFAYTGISQITIPQNVTTIGAYAFTGSKIQSITIPDAVTSIGNYCFDGAYSLEELNISETSELTYMGEYMARETAITSVTIPSKVTVISKYAFDKAANLENVNFVEGGTEELMMGTIEVSNTGVVKTLMIGYVFRGTAIKNITFPKRLTIIGTYSFNEMSELKTATVPEGSMLESVGNYAFNGCTSLESFYFPSTLKIQENWKKSNEQIAGIGRYAFAECTSLTDVTFDLTPSDNLYTIASRAFYNCTGLTELNMPGRFTDSYGMSGTATNHVYGIAKDSFSGCSNLTAINITPATINEDEGMMSIDGVVYTEDGSELVFCPAAKEGKVVVPATVEKIRPLALNDCTKLTEVEFEAGELDLVIDDDAFNGCTSIKSMVMPARLDTIGESAFSNMASLEQFTFEEGCRLSTMEQKAFALDGASVNNKLATIEIPASLKTLNKNTFDGCKYLTTVTFEEGSQLNEIKADAFANSGLTSITLPSSVKKIADSIFEGCTALEEVTLSDNLTDVATLFAGCLNIDRVVVNETNEYFTNDENGIVFSESMQTLAYYPSGRTEKEYRIPDGVTTIADYAFAYNDKIEKVIVPESVTSIGDYTFYKMTALTDVVFESGMKDLTFGDRVFYASTIERIVLPARLTSMGTHCFYDCDSLTSVEFETSARLTVLPKHTFYGSEALRGVTLPSVMTQIEDNAFQNCSSVDYIRFENGVSSLKKLGASSLRAMTSLVEFEVPSTCTSFGTYTFTQTALKEIVIPHGTKSLPNYCFNECSQLEVLIIPDTVTSIGTYFAEECYELKELTLMGVSKINNNSFLNCYNLERLTLGDKIKTIGNKAFMNCYKLKKLTIPASVSNDDDTLAIGSEAFSNCYALEELIFEVGDGAMTIGEKAFYNCNSLKELILPDRLDVCDGEPEIGADAFYGASSLLSLTIPGCATEIGANAFAEARNLKEIIVMFGVEVIGDFAFSNSVNVEYISIPETVRALGNNPFMGCSKVSEFALAETNSDILFKEGVLYNGSETQIIWCPTSTSGVVTIPETVTKIAGGAFAGCNLVTEVILHDSITEIEDNTFTNSGLTRIVIGKNITKIGAGAFAGCTNLSEVVFEKGGVNALSFGDNAFEGCVSLTEIELPYRLRSYTYYKSALYDEAGCHGIGNYAFANCTNLASVTFETTGTDSESVANAVISFGAYSFYNCTSLTSIEFPAYLSNCGKPGKLSFSTAEIRSAIDAYAFANSALTEVKFSADRAPIEEAGPPTNAIQLGGDTRDGITIDEYAFKDCVGITQITIPEYTKEVLAGAFEGTNIKSVTIPKSVGEIAEYTFANCTQLETVILLGHVQEVGDYAFSGCEKLASFTVNQPTSFTDIGNYAFSGCTSLSEFTIFSNVEFVGKGAFAMWGSKQTVKADFTQASEGWDEGWQEGCNAQIVWQA